MTANTCEVHVGRLLEIRVSKGYHTPEDVDAMMEAMRACVQQLSHAKHVTVADWRACKLMSAAACERATQMFLASNPTTERAAILCSEQSPTAVWQFLRLVSTGDNPNRRLSKSVAEVVEWLGEVLTPEERARLEAFLATPPTPFAP